MSYQTKNEWEHFDFQEAVIAEARQCIGFFEIMLENVKILPENSCNRDIRTMRCNGLLLHIEEGAIVSLVEEGYQIYDANGNLKEKKEDRVIAASDYQAHLQGLQECVIYSLKKEENLYHFSIDTDDHTYDLKVSGTGDIEEWDRFLNL